MAAARCATATAGTGTSRPTATGGNARKPTGASKSTTAGVAGFCRQTGGHATTRRTTTGVAGARRRTTGHTRRSTVAGVAVGRR